MKLEELGYNPELERYRIDNGLTDFAPGRVIAEHKESYVVGTESGELKAEVTGNLRFAAQGRADFPAVGDWVALTICDADFAVIHKILPRSSVISRQAVGQFGEVQIIATNIDHAFLVQAVDRDFNLNRLERYLTICHAAQVGPIIVLTKVDLIDETELAGIIDRVRRRIENTPVIAISNATQAGYEALLALIEKGKTYCMLGSSGVGKSTLLNNLSGRALMRTDAISASTSKGRHVTTHRELIVLAGGGMLIDNPGMREVGIVDAGQGLETTFDKIMGLARDCRFKDCTHVNEAGCAVLAAVAKGGLDASAYDSYLKMEREKAHFESTLVERRKKDKDFGKMVKSVKKHLKKGKR
ncbi:MAG: ribosome small subunit-dependent GTPase A [Thermodesulfobacteriota bacterium]